MTRGLEVYVLTTGLPTELYTLSLHDALPIFWIGLNKEGYGIHGTPEPSKVRDRKSTRLNSSHPSRSHAVFFLKRKRRTVPARRFSRCSTMLGRLCHTLLQVCRRLRRPKRSHS